MPQKKIILKNNAIGLLTFPQNHQKVKYPAVLLLHGFASDKHEYNNVYDNISNNLLEKNFVTLQIDFRGHGESTSIKTKDATIISMKEDALLAFNYLAALSFINKDKIGMIGISLGAAIAALITDELYITTLKCKAIAMLSPVAYFADDFITILGEPTIQKLCKSSHYLTIDLSWKKIELDRNFYQTLQKFNHASISAIEKYKGALLCIAGEKDFSCKNAKEYYKICPTIKKKLIIVKNADHIFNILKNRNKLLEYCLCASHWIQKQLL